MQHLTALHWTSLQIFASQEYITQCSIDCTVFYWLSLLLLHHCNVLSVIALYLLHWVALHYIALHCAALNLALHVQQFVFDFHDFLNFYCIIATYLGIIELYLLHCIALHCAALNLALHVAAVRIWLSWLSQLLLQDPRSCFACCPPPPSICFC